jgi:hypothetical protein
MVHILFEQLGARGLALLLKIRTTLTPFPTALLKTVEATGARSLPVATKRTVQEPAKWFTSNC